MALYTCCMAGLCPTIASCEAAVLSGPKSTRPFINRAASSALAMVSSMARGSNGLS